MNTKLLGLATLACAAAALLATPVLGQVVRESDTKTLAGLLDSAWNPADSFAFFSQGDEILFADVDAELFQVKGRRGGSHEDDEGDCGGHTTDALAADDGHDHDHDDSGGPGGLCLQVLDASGTMLCWADRPARPGWMRDPAIACPLPKTRGNTTYTLRVSLKSGGCGPGGHGGHETAIVASSAEAKVTPYLLNWSLRRIATDGRLQGSNP